MATAKAALDSEFLESELHDQFVRMDIDYTAAAVAIADRGALKPGARILIPGCGTGPLERALAGLGMRCTGLDFIESSVDFCRQRAAAEGLSIAYFQGDFLAWNSEREFDAAAIFNVDLSVNSARKWLAHVKALLRPCGMVFFLGIEFDPAHATVGERAFWRGTFEADGWRAENESACWWEAGLQLKWAETTIVRDDAGAELKSFGFEGLVDLLPAGGAEQALREAGFSGIETIYSRESYVHPATQGRFLSATA
ncbi:hypothetical protein BH09SUM1_BH09SUM1_07370 [soil metagenome]